MLHLLYNNGIL